MLSRRCHFDVSVLRSKIYVYNHDCYHQNFRHQLGEVFDIAKGKWEALPKPPNFLSTYPERICISAAFKSPKRILVAYCAKDITLSLSSMRMMCNTDHGECLHQLSASSTNCVIQDGEKLQ
jgi:hypothetical protein